MVRMKALRSFRGGAGEGYVKRGMEFSTHSLARANELEAHGLGYRIDPIKPVANPINETMIPAENTAANTGPLALAGGETGAAKPVPSSPPARQPRKRRSSGSGGDLLS